MVVRDKGQQPRVDADPGYLSMRVPGPALLKSEKRSEYEAFKQRILDALQCKDPIERIYAESFVDDSWEIARLRKALPTLLNHNAKKHLERIPAKRSADKEPLANVLAAFSRAIKHSRTEEEKEQQLNEIGKISDQEEIEVSLEDEELADAMAVESSINLQVTLERLINDKYKRRNDTLRQIEWYKGFADRLKRASDAAIEAAVHGSKHGTLQNASATLAPAIE